MFRPVSRPNSAVRTAQLRTATKPMLKTLPETSFTAKPKVSISQARFAHTPQHVIQRKVDEAQVADLRKQFTKEVGEKYNERIRQQTIEYKKFRAKVAAYRHHKSKIKAKRMEKHKLWMRLLKMEYTKLNIIRENNRKFVKTMWSEWLKQNLRRMKREHLSTGFIIAENLKEGVQNAASVAPEPYNIFGVPAHVFNREGVMNNDLSRGKEYDPGNWNTRLQVDPDSGRIMPWHESEPEMEEIWTSFGIAKPSDFALDILRGKALGKAVLSEYRKTDAERWGLTSELDEIKRRGDNIDEQSLMHIGNMDSLQFKDLTEDEISNQITQLRKWFATSPLDPPANTVPEQQEEEIDELFDTLRNFTIQEKVDKLKGDSLDFVDEGLQNEQDQLADFEELLDDYDSFDFEA